jgi:hypothetical protein
MGAFPLGALCAGDSKENSWRVYAKANSGLIAKELRKDVGGTFHLDFIE